MSYGQRMDALGACGSHESCRRSTDALRVCGSCAGALNGHTLTVCRVSYGSWETCADMRIRRHWSPGCRLIWHVFPKMEENIVSYNMSPTLPTKLHIGPWLSGIAVYSPLICIPGMESSGVDLRYGW